ncbi:MAG: thioredoxin family protein [Lentisphaeria bacterium]|nr:thioredoxin family protein [Lentisphaeria bacterium]
MKKILILLLLLTAVFVRAEQNFRWSLETGKIRLEIADGCYIYLDSLKIEAFSAENKKLQTILPRTIIYDDEFSGKVQIVPSGVYLLDNKENLPVASAKIAYQGCKSSKGDDAGICFMPQDIVLGRAVKNEIISPQKSFLDDFTMLRKHEGTMSVEQMTAFLRDTQTVEAQQEENPLADKSAWLILLILLSGGFLLNFTPCVLPMIPINLAIIGAGGEKTAKAGFWRGVFYAVGMTCAYGALGIAAIVSGMRFGELNSNMYFNFAIALIFFVLALAMAGVWNLDFSAKLNSINPMKWNVARPIAIFFMGATAALLAGACVAPAVIGMIILAMSLYKTAPAAGLAVPFVFGAGMGILWIAAGATMGKILPKPGKWMVYVKNILAVFIALCGIYYAWVGISLIPGKFNAENEVRLLKEALNNSDKKVFIDFWASWCKNCSYMEKNVLSAPEVQTQLLNYTVVKFQAENLKNPAVAEILQKYNIQGLPAFVIIERKK